jgi:indole-3-glycerol phosphate synthase
VTAASAAPPDILVEITARRRERLAAAGGSLAPPTVAPRPLQAPPRTARDNPFLAALGARRGAGPPAPPAIIAEIKLGSPRLGSLRGRVDAERTARAYAAAGAAALSVVVEPDFFHGDPDLLRRCREASGLPAIAKDFVVSEYQIFEGRAAGADAVLLIAALYRREELQSWAAAARGLGLAPLVEIHDQEDLDKLAGAPWELVGVNSRDLRTFAIDFGRAAALAPRLPPEALKVAESGIATRADVVGLQTAGFDAFLVGEALLLADDPGRKLAELLG